MLSRWDPFTELSRLQDEMFRAFGQEDRNGAQSQALAFRPAVDIVEGKDAIWLKAELPGVKNEDVHIEIEKNVLTLRGERKNETKVEKDNFFRYERRFGQFARSFVLPENVDGNAIDAEMKDGVLTVKLPKKAAEQPRKIAVKAGSAPQGSGPVGTA
jgi:HSP20 family protein